MITFGPPIPIPAWMQKSFPDPSKIGARYIDNNFWQITEAKARELCKPHKLPRHGYERIISFQGFRCMVQRTIVDRTQVWALHVTSDPLDP